MSATKRQTALFASEDWKVVYSFLTKIDFSSYDQDTLRAALVDYIKLTYPSDFNDFIQSSEFLIKLDTLCYLVSSLAYRLDLNTRENFLDAAERRSSVLSLVGNVAYNISRLQAASGELKIMSIRTNQPLLDLDDKSLANVTVKWNDPLNVGWYDSWLIVLNAAFDSRTKWGKPLRRYTSGADELSLFRLNSPSPPTGVYPFTADLGGVSLPVELINVLINETLGSYTELSPDSANGFHMLYRSDSMGASSSGSGFFFPIRQGTMTHQDFNLDTMESLRLININEPNINDTDVWVQKIDTSGNVLEYWTRTDAILNESLAFNTAGTKNIFEVITRDQDQIAIRFGDGKQGAIPVGTFRIWYRVSSPVPYLIKKNDIKSKVIVVPYVSEGQIFNLSVELTLQESISNASASETIDEIKSKASKVFYTQNRMVNGEDYNSFPLKDNSVLKIKAINRIFAGKSKNLNIKDNTGVYDNITLFADDGRLYKEYKTTSKQFSYNPVTQSLDTFIQNNIVPMLGSEDKQIFYYNNYSAINYNQELVFTVDSTVAGRSRGHFSQDLVDGMVDFYLPNALLSFSTGETARLDYIAANTTGTEPNTVFIKKNLALTEAYVTSVFPPLRIMLLQAETNLIVERMLLKKSFGIRWDFASQTYTIIKAENFSADPFTLAYAGDTSGTNKDTSWLIGMVFNNTQNGEDFWTISERGLFYTFESESQVNFIHVNDAPIVDNVSGKQLRDSVILLPENETKQSLPRRGEKRLLGNDPYAGRIVLVGDGTTDAFPIQTDRMSSDFIFFEVNGVVTSRSDWELKSNSGKFFIKFSAPLSLGAIVTVIYDSRKINMIPLRVELVGDFTSTTYFISQHNVRTENTMLFVNGLEKGCFDDYKVYPTSLVDRVKLNVAPTTGAAMSIFTLSGGEPIFNTYTFLGTGSAVSFPLRIHTNFMMVFVNGVLVTNYTVDTSVVDSDFIVFNTAPANNDVIHIKALIPDSLSLVETNTTVATASQQLFNPPGTRSSVDRTMVFVNGHFSHTSFYDPSQSKVVLSPPATLNDVVKIFTLTVTASNSLSYDIVSRTEFDASPSYLGVPKTFLIYDQARYVDGYTNTKAVLVTNVDADINGEIDDPANFSSLVIEDGLSDLVLWRKVVVNGFDIWEPISDKTIPRGTYHSKLYSYSLGDTVTDDIPVGAVHYDYVSGLWLLADATTGLWISAPTQADYRWLIGRGGLKFKWLHYTSSEQQINPSSSNLHDIFVLTKEYDAAIRQWIDANDDSDQPDAPSLVTLKTQYAYLLDHKMISDTVIWNPATYKFLFGPKALPELQTKFLVVKTLGSNIPDNDLKLKILSVIDEYFGINLWDFGESFYFTELAAFVHSRLANYVQTFVPVSLNGQPFGRMFEIRCEPNEIFLNTASPTQIEVVDSLTDSRLNIKF